MIEGTHTLTSLGQLDEFAKNVSSALGVGDVVLLVGELGSGKTTFTQAIGRSLGVSDRMVSPTFTVEARYPNQHGRVRELVHIDLYRVDTIMDGSEYALHMKELFEGAAEREQIIFIEWPDRLGTILPSVYWKIEFEHVDRTSKRAVTIRKYGKETKDSPH